MSDTASTDARGRLMLGKKYRNSDYTVEVKGTTIILTKIPTIAPKKNTSRE